MTTALLDKSANRVRSLVWLMALVALTAGGFTLWCVGDDLRRVEAHHRATAQARGEVFDAVESLRRYRLNGAASLRQLGAMFSEGDAAIVERIGSPRLEYDGGLVEDRIIAIEENLGALGWDPDRGAVGLGDLSRSLESVYGAINEAWHQASKALTTTQRATAVVQELRDRLRRLNSLVVTEVGRRKLHLATQLYSLDEVAGEGRLERLEGLARSLSSGLRPQQLQADLWELALLTERISAVEGIDRLRDLQVNRAPQSLARLRRDAVRLEGGSRDFLEQLRAFELGLIGDGAEPSSADREEGLDRVGLCQLKRRLFEERSNLTGAIDRADTLAEVCRKKERSVRASVTQLAADAAIANGRLLRGASKQLFAVSAAAGLAFLLATWWIVSLVGRVMRVSAERHAERQRLLEESSELATIIRESPNEVFIIDASSLNFLEVNKGACNSTGYVESELLQMTPAEIVPDLLRGDLESLYGPLLDGRKGEIEFQTQHRRKDGSTYPVQIRLHRAIYRGVEVVVAFASDLSETHRLEQKLAQAQKLESIGQLAAGIAHEINTPMQCVAMNVEYIQMSLDQLFEIIVQLRTDLETEAVPWEVRRNAFQALLRSTRYDTISEQAPAAVEEAAEASRRIVEIVRAMKAMSHPGGQDKSAADVNEVIRNAATISRNRWKYTAELEFDLEEALPAIYALPAELNQVFLNLIVNAADAITEKTGGSGPLGKITVRTHLDGDEVCIEVKDTGSGIPASVREKVFDPFFTTKEVGKGTGQGLAITYDVVVNKHGGSIDLDSTEGEGATFAIRLPIGQAPLTPDMPALTSESGELDPVLIDSLETL